MIWCAGEGGLSFSVCELLALAELEERQKFLFFSGAVHFVLSVCNCNQMTKAKLANV